MKKDCLWRSFLYAKTFKVELIVKKIVIFGNSGSGKSTLARQLSAKHNLPHFDLDTIAWAPSVPPQRMSIDNSSVLIEQFVYENEQWIIEGCYSDLIELVLPIANKVIFLNLTIDDCIKNAKKRPWEPHKYQSKDEQDKNLSMLIDWIRDYDNRADTFSKAAHQALYDSFKLEKIMYDSNVREES